MQLSVRLAGAHFTVILDIGLTHNFISQAAAARVGLRLQPRQGMSVSVANGDCITSSGVNQSMQLTISPENFTVDFYAILLDESMLLTISPENFTMDFYAMLSWASNGFKHSARFSGISHSAPWRFGDLTVECLGVGLACLPRRPARSSAPARIF